MQNSLYHEFAENATSVVFAFACCRLYNIELLGIFAQMLPENGGRRYLQEGNGL
jgi:hypothetical protein